MRKMMLRSITYIKKDANEKHMRGIEGLDWEMNKNLFSDNRGK